MTMLEKVKEFLKNNWQCVMAATLILVSLSMLIYAYRENGKMSRRLREIEYIDSNNVYRKLYYEREIKNLKEVNRQLYDSIKGFKDEISYLIQFKYEKEYHTGIIYTGKNGKEGKKEENPTATDTTTTITQPNPVNVYVYSNSPTDTLHYDLVIGSTREPNWYSLNVKLSDRFTIINREHGDINEISIGGNNQGNVSDVTVFKRKEKRTMADRVSFGPGIVAGYDPFQGRFFTGVAITVTYDLK